MTSSIFFVRRVVEATLPRIDQGSAAMRTERILYSIVLVCFMIIVTSPQVFANEPLADIIDNVRTNELLYDEIEVIWHRHYEKVNPKRPLPGMRVSQDTNGRYIRQNGMFYFDLQGEKETSTGDIRKIHRR